MTLRKFCFIDFLSIIVSMITRNNNNYRLVLTALLTMFIGQSFARTTGNGVTRNLNLDGVVNIGSSVGTNTADWEPDEEFEGFEGAVDWYLSWDDDNIYIGRIKGNNTEGSLIYIRADYSGATFTDSINVDYDGFFPYFQNMEGINYVAYVKDNYDEYRTFDGTNWNQTSGGANKHFSDQGGNAHMELAIPWTQITQGNGKPDNLRIVFYQALADGGCVGGTNIYGESPWGTGDGDSPSVGVNDGTGEVTAKQPGGCSAADERVLPDLITRWWGCYPVIAGVSSNGWLATRPKAGPDAFICGADYTMQGNEPAAEAIGTWNIIEQPSGSSIPNFGDLNNPTTSISDLEPGVYVFTWSINYGRCPSEPDTMRLEVGAPFGASVAVVGPPDDNGTNGSVQINNPVGGFPPYSTSLDGANYQTGKLEYNNLLPGEYEVYVRDSLGCEIELEFEILNVPTGFSPNGDGINDTWTLSGLDEYPNATFEIYGVWGGLIHSGSLLSGVVTWDGNFNGNPAPEANYYYIVDLGQGSIIKGAITLIR